MSDDIRAIIRGPRALASAPAFRAELIGAIADLAVAARAGTLRKAYEREFAWPDKENGIDAVDADEFNAAFHAIEREFDKLAEILAEGAGGLPAPDWDSGEVRLSGNLPVLRLEHRLGTTDLLVDLKVRLDATRHDPMFANAVGWTNSAVGDEIVYGLPDPDHIVIMAGGRLFPQGAPDLVVRAVVWQW
jgi:hypothetical protein